MECIKLDHIKTNVEVDSWEDAIYFAGELLEKDELIDHIYTDNIIQAVKEFGTYMVLLPEFVLAHSAPCSAVKESSMSLITLKKKLPFYKDDVFVSVILFMACKDKTSHMENLKKIAEKLMIDGTIEKIKTSQDSLDIYKLLNE
ncbi:MAG: PTS sugar transporter subunit IIA [Erysipelotrichaceae bacterium]|nr:PTS sugar transporter subunit IIA [Erysipelotrichaceae bacterium]